MSCCSIFCRSTRSGSLLRQSLQVVTHGCVGEPVLDPEGPRNCSTAQREFEALKRGMQMRSPAWRDASWIRLEGQALSGSAYDDSQQWKSVV